MNAIKRVIKSLLPALDAIAAVFTLPAAAYMFCIRRIGVQHLPFSRRIFAFVGFFPIRDHYYEPLFHAGQLSKPLNSNRSLPGLQMNVGEQLSLLEQFRYSEDILGLEGRCISDISFRADNGSFLEGDFEFLYSLIRAKRPKRIIEVGSGNSTIVAALAIIDNKSETPNHECTHICIEPYEMPWLEKLGVTVLRERVETLSPAFFAQLGENDLLFIDSSHVIRPQGDVLHLYLEVLPTLAPGVIVHIHDIFTPNDYLSRWVTQEVKLWNEQYLVEAFLSNNAAWRIIGALNFLHKAHFNELKSACPLIRPTSEPGSLYIQRCA
ncbi:MAG: class I SAM-dependent methyltransferase [Betaproteobacteria bacterium]|nr:class I SAM-dependent methyltransferase [Betaproteobacteria bacterium]